MNTHYQETRIALVIRIASEARDARQLVVSDFAERFVVLARDLTPTPFEKSNLRLPHPTDGAQHQKDLAHNRQIVERWLTGTVKSFPVEFEEPWVLALPPEHREKALAQLSARYGLLAARQRHPGEGLSAFSDILADTAALTDSMSPILADGCIDARDRPYLKPALERVSALQASLAGLGGLMAHALEDLPATNVRDLKKAG